MSCWNLQNTLSSETMLPTHEFGFLSFPVQNRRPLVLEQHALPSAGPPALTVRVPQSPRRHGPTALWAAHTRWLSWKGERQRRFGAKPSLIKRGDSSPEKWSDKVSVVKLGTANEAVPAHPVFCQRIRNQVPPVPAPIRCVSCGVEEAEWGATPQNSWSLSDSYIRVKHKIPFERKGFTVNKHLENHHMAE